MHVAFVFVATVRVLSSKSHAHHMGQGRYAHAHNIVGAVLHAGYGTGIHPYRS